MDVRLILHVAAIRDRTWMLSALWIVLICLFGSIRGLEFLISGITPWLTELVFHRFFLSFSPLILVCFVLSMCTVLRWVVVQ